MDEQIFIAALKQGDENAFKQLVETYADKVFNTALGIVHSTEDAEDLAQEVFIKVHDAIENFKGNSLLSTWIYRITVTKSIDLLRKKKRKKTMQNFVSIFDLHSNKEIEIKDFHHPGVALEQKENAAMLFKAIENLPANQQTAFVLNKIEGLSYKEICEIMQLSNAALESLLHRARTNLKKHLRKILKD